MNKKIISNSTKESASLSKISQERDQFRAHLMKSVQQTARLKEEYAKE